MSFEFKETRLVLCLSSALEKVSCELPEDSCEE